MQRTKAGIYRFVQADRLLATPAVVALIQALEPMIDAQARSKLAEASRWLVTGLITNFQYDDRVLDDAQIWASRDPAVREIHNKGFWLMYDDLRQNRFKDKDRLSPQTRGAAARCVLFLKSDASYGWPVLSHPASLGLTVLNLVTLGFASLVYSARARRGRDIAYWPFTSQEQYNKALQSPVYLSGRER